MNSNMNSNMNSTINSNMNSKIDKCLSELRPSIELSVTRIVRNILEKIAEDYSDRGLTKIELYKKYLNIDYNNEDITTLNKNNYIERKCHALTKEYTQCSRNPFGDTKFCQSHGKILKNNGSLLQGTIFKRVENQQTLNNNKIIYNPSQNIEVVLEKITNEDNNEIFVNIDTNVVYEKDGPNSVKQISK